MSTEVTTFDVFNMLTSFSQQDLCLLKSMLLKSKKDTQDGTYWAYIIPSMVNVDRNWRRGDPEWYYQISAYATGVLGRSTDKSWSYTHRYKCFVDKLTEAVSVALKIISNKNKAMILEDKLSDILRSIDNMRGDEIPSDS